METTLEIKSGKELTKSDLEVVNLARKNEFRSKDPINPVFGNRDWKAQFFFLHDSSNKVVALGVVEIVKIRFCNSQYDVPCFSTIIAIEKGRGYGGLIMKEIRSYVETLGKTTFGFCETKLVSFYQSIGFEVLSADENNFVYLDASENVIEGIVPGEVIFIRGRDGLMEKILQNTDKIAGVYRTGSDLS